MAKKFGVLLARQRSGTGALGSVLDMHPALHYLGEIFHPDNLGQNNNYFTHLMERVRQTPENALPTNNQSNMDTFIDNMSKEGSSPVIDIKYRSLYHCSANWQGLHEQPWLLTYAKQNRAPIIHLTRKNFVESFVSGRLAEANKVWHAKASDNISTTSIVVNIRHLSAYIHTSDLETKSVRNWLRKYPSAIELDYADLFDDEGSISEAASGQISEMFGIGPFTLRKPAFVKQAPRNLRQSVENFDLLRQALSGTPHEWMVSE